MTNTADRRDPDVRRALRKAGLLNAAGPVQAQFLSTADLRRYQNPGTPIARSPFRRASVKRVSVEGVLTEIVTADGHRYPWPEQYLPEEPEPGWNRRVHACFQWQAEDYLHDKGWFTWHCEYDHMSQPDILDLLCLREREMWIELKVRSVAGVANGMSPGQWTFFNRLVAAKREVHIITWPDDWEKFKELAA